MRFISFDSGLERTGYAVFETSETEYELLTYGCITTSRQKGLHERIHDVSIEVEKLVSAHNPEMFVIEQLFFMINKKTAISVAQSQGTVLQIAGKHGLDVAFLKPNEIKQSITGYGNADKKSVQKMVMMILELDEPPQPDDTADAIACGITYCTMKQFHDRQT